MKIEIGAVLTWSSAKTIARDFVLKDRRGLFMGARATMHTVVTADGTFYSMRPSATRGNVPFGATQATRYYCTELERDKAVVKYFDLAERRARRARKSA